MSCSPAARTSAAQEAVRREVPDWDDEVVSTARFKALSGQRSDWEPKYLFWRDLILKVARHLGAVAIRPSEVKNVWFTRGGLTPLCIDRVLGVKISLTAAPLPSISSLDYDSLHLIWTMEKLQQQLDVIDRRCEISKKQALASLKSGNKQAAYRHVRQSKSLSESRAKCTSLLERVEEVHGIIADAESTKKVSEAIQVGVRAMKENRISVEELHLHLRELDDAVAAHKQVNEALEMMTLESVDYDEQDVEEDLKKLEMEVANEKPPAEIQKPGADSLPEQVNTEHPSELLSETMSHLNLEAA